MDTSHRIVSWGKTKSSRGVPYNRSVYKDRCGPVERVGKGARGEGKSVETIRIHGRDPPLKHQFKNESQIA